MNGKLVLVFLVSLVLWASVVPAQGLYRLPSPTHMFDSSQDLCRQMTRYANMFPADDIGVKTPPRFGDFSPSDPLQASAILPIATILAQLHVTRNVPAHQRLPLSWSVIFTREAWCNGAQAYGDGVVAAYGVDGLLRTSFYIAPTGYFCYQAPNECDFPMVFERSRPEIVDVATGLIVNTTIVDVVEYAEVSVDAAPSLGSGVRSFR